MEKKTETVTAHVDDVTKLRFARLAKVKGSCESKLAGEIIEAYLQAEYDNFRLLQTVFDFDGSMGSDA